MEEKEMPVVAALTQVLIFAAVIWLMAAAPGLL
jgi:hypothetical protein